MPSDVEPPAWATFREVELEADLDLDGACELLALRGRRLRVSKGARALLASDASWQVSDVLVADFDGDGMPEVALLLWKRGSYGSVRPFWEGAAQGRAGASDSADSDATDRDGALTQHLFVYRCRPDGRLRPVWMSSALGVEAARVAVENPADGSRPRLRVTSAAGRVTRWAWLSWGFALVGEGASADVPAPGVAGAASGGDGALDVLVVGDNIAHAGICAHAWDARARAYDFAPLYAHVRDRVSSCDFAAVCQETPLVANPARTSGYPVFATPQAMGTALARAGFSAVLGATNHANDQGPAAIDDELAFWAREHPRVAVVGLHARPEEAGEPAWVERGGFRLALFDCTYGLNGRDLAPEDAWRVDVLAGGGVERLVAGVERAREGADLVICFLHMGQEYESEPTEGQRALAGRLIDAGAAAVVCSHAHVLGPWGHVTTASGSAGVVFYGLGNFVSGQCDDIATVVGGAALLRVERGPSGAAHLARCELAPLVCHADARDGSTATYFLDDYSDDLAARHVLSRGGAPLTVAALRALALEESHQIQHA